MMFGSNVQPKKRPPREPGRPWFCDCARAENGIGTWRPGYLARCNDCGKKRPS